MCPECYKELFIDHVDSDGKYVYVCMNPKCPQYRIGFYLTDDKPAESSIKPDK